ncbi:hypothetical protein CB1_056579117 [Camelus ferus]|nr:hypothetical protein CB1_056579117 [Camelus ferus]
MSTSCDYRAEGGSSVVTDLTFCCTLSYTAAKILLFPLHHKLIREDLATRCIIIITELTNGTTTVPQTPSSLSYPQLCSSCCAHLEVLSSRTVGLLLKSHPSFKAQLKAVSLWKPNPIPVP